jgi:P pilus assembly chaperone PapD
VTRLLRRVLLPVLLLAPSVLRAQGVLVAPHAVIMDHRTRSGSITLYNPGDEPAEVTLSAFFGFPVTDSTGTFELRTIDQPTPDYPSAAGWIDAFPRRVLLAPKQRQMVRLLARPPAGLADGEYWARLVISAKGGTVPVQGVADSSGVTVSLGLEVRTIIPVQYRKGRVATGVRTSALSAEVTGDSLAVRLRLDRTGNAAFLGTLRGALVDSAGKVVASVTSPLAVYYDMEPRLMAPLPTPLGRGRYRLKVDVAAQREDLAPELVLATPAVRDSVEVHLP